MQAAVTQFPGKVLSAVSTYVPSKETVKGKLNSFKVEVISLKKSAEANPKAATANAIITTLFFLALFSPIPAILYTLGSVAFAAKLRYTPLNAEQKKTLAAKLINIPKCLGAAFALNIVAKTLFFSVSPAILLVEAVGIYACYDMYKSQK